MRRLLSLLLLVSAQANSFIPVDCATQTRRLTALEAETLGLRINSGTYGPHCYEVVVHVPMQLEGRQGGFAYLRLYTGNEDIAFMDLPRGDTTIEKYANSFIACNDVDRALMTVTYGVYCKDVVLVLPLRRRGDTWVLSE